MPLVATFMVPHPPLIVAEVGKGSEKQVQTTIDSYRAVAQEIAELKPETIIITSPHSIMYSDYFHISPGTGATGRFARFGAPQVSFREEYDRELVSAICHEAESASVSAGTEGEKDSSLDHGTMVPLYFVRQCYTGFKLVRIGLSGQPYREHYRLGQCIKRAVEKTGRRTVLIASGDLSHKLSEDGPYGFAPEGPEYDRRIMDVMSRAAFGDLFTFDESFCDKAAECGHRSFIIMAGALDESSVEAKCYSHEGTTGVGYGICSYRPIGSDASRAFLSQYEEKEKARRADIRSREDAYVRLARLTVECYTQEGSLPRVDGSSAIFPDGTELPLPDDMRSRQAGTFVSLHLDGQLRGCIGTIGATQPSIAEEIVHNAVSACSRDPRFSRVRKDELASIEYSVDVLGPIEEISSRELLDVKRYGVICSKGNRRGLLLPNLDGVESVDQQIEIACRKGGIRPSEEPELSRFEVVRHY
ncbi:MAG: AmmeMemoRadiSam system protein A [Treponema sp.]|nr:AmmeMemoRadiSam system protein A [Treponema sp.]